LESVYHPSDRAWPYCHHASLEGVLRCVEPGR
jgi:hypothetical protein